MSHRQKSAKEVVATARCAFNKGFTKQIKYRLKQLNNFIKFLQQHEEEIVQSMYDDLRKHREEARLEIIVAINHLNYLINNVRKWTRPENPPKRLVDTFDGLYIYHDPYGVVLVMGSWNVPLLTLVPVTAANKYLTPNTLELGGKNPVYIDSSANLELTAERVMWGKCFNSGQACIAPDYILCTKEVEKIFLEHAKKAVQKFYGDNPKSCPIVNDHHFRRLSGLLNGLTIALGGRTDALENYIELTVAIDVKPEHPVMQEEIFGPILPIVTVQNVQEAVNFINQREKALALYIFTKSPTVQTYIIENTSCGGVTVNDTLVHLITESLPFGGVGFSGMGCYKGKDSYDTFVHRKSVLVKNFWGIIEM
ncbi:Aldedh domain containing protein, partial [Asbolus verrucosus]